MNVWLEGGLALLAIAGPYFGWWGYEFGKLAGWWGQR